MTKKSNAQIRNPGDESTSEEAEHDRQSGEPDYDGK